MQPKTFEQFLPKTPSQIIFINTYFLQTYRFATSGRWSIARHHAEA